MDKQIDAIRDFNRFYTDLIGLLDNHLLNSDYSLAEARILYEIHAGGQVSASAIINKLSIDKGYLSRIIKRFERSDLLAKTADKSDARIMLLSLTKAGQQVFNELNAASNEQILTLISTVSVPQLNELVGHMEAIKRLLKK